MKKSTMTFGLVLLVSSLLISGCSKQPVASPAIESPPVSKVASRGEFGIDSCKENERVPIDSSAVYALYLDENGDPVGGPFPMGAAEDLKGTGPNMMCPTPTDDTGSCPARYCPRLVSGKTYCLRC